MLNIFNLDNYSVSLLFLNIYIYIILLITIFLIFFLFDLRYFKTLNELKGFFNIPFLTVFIIIIFLSLAGMPPMLGFLGKFLIVIFFLFKSNFLILILFLFLNLFSIYFYIINLRYLVTKNYNTFFFYKNNNVYINFTILFFIIIFVFFNIFGIFFFNDLIILFSYFFF